MDKLLHTAELYKEFSVFFRQPIAGEEWFDEEFIKSFTSRLFHLIPELETEINHFLDVVEKKEIEDIVLEYTYNFIGPFKVLVYLYGSCYLDEEKQLNQESTQEVGDIYARMGVEISEEFKNLPDHIVPEMEFMNFLITNFINEEKDFDFSNDELLETQKIFFNDYLYPFASEVCLEISRKTKGEFYNSLAILFSKFLEIESKRLN